MMRRFYLLYEHEHTFQTVWVPWFQCTETEAPYYEAWLTLQARHWLRTMPSFDRWRARSIVEFDDEGHDVGHWSSV